MIKKAEVLTFVLLVCLAVSCFVFAGTHTPWDGTAWDVASPDIDQPHGNTYKEIFDLRKGVALRMNKEHETLATSEAGGVHKQGSARAFFQDAEPATQVDTSAFDSGDLGSLWFDSNAAIDNQFLVLTATTPTWTPVSTEIIAFLLASNRTFAGTLTVTGESTFNNHVNLGAGDDLVGSTTSDINIGSGNFTVAGATGNTVVGGTLGVTGASTFTAGITANGGVTLGAGDDLIGSSTSDITINTNKFTVAGASGNTLVAGTLDVQGNIDPTTYETTNGGFLDEDDLASDSANMVASQQSIKAYIDSNDVDGDDPTTDDSTDDTLAKSHAYLTQTSGFVTAYCVGGATDDLIGYVDTDTDPADGGTVIAHSAVNGGGDKAFIMFFVANGKYFEITSDNSTTIIWTPLVSGGAAPVDQD
jgi:hypothetical protein